MWLSQMLERMNRKSEQIQEQQCGRREWKESYEANSVFINIWLDSIVNSYGWILKPIASAFDRFQFKVGANCEPGSCGLCQFCFHLFISLCDNGADFCRNASLVKLFSFRLVNFYDPCQIFPISSIYILPFSSLIDKPEIFHHIQIVLSLPLLLVFCLLAENSSRFYFSRLDRSD